MIEEKNHELDRATDLLQETELKRKLMAAEEMIKQLAVQKKKRPKMTEEDVVKFVFQGMLGVGHLVADPAAAQKRLKAEWEEISESTTREPLIEKISGDWVRLNLRTAKAKGIAIEDIVYWFYESSQISPLSFTRQNVYQFCVKYDGSDTMQAAAERILDENWLPSHSEPYRAAYHPAYRVLHRDFRHFKKEE